MMLDTGRYVCVAVRMAAIIGWSFHWVFCVRRRASGGFFFFFFAEAVSAVVLYGSIGVCFVGRALLFALTCPRV